MDGRPRLTAEADGTAVYAALASVTGEDLAVAQAHATADTLTVRWADGATGEVAFAPLSVRHLPSTV